MARRLPEAGHVVRAWDRSGNPGVDGLRMVGDVADSLNGDVAFTLLADDAATREVVLGTGILSQARLGVVTSSPQRFQSRLPTNSAPPMQKRDMQPMVVGGPTGLD